MTDVNVLTVFEQQEDNDVTNARPPLHKSLSRRGTVRRKSETVSKAAAAAHASTLEQTETVSRLEAGYSPIASLQLAECQLIRLWFMDDIATAREAISRLEHTERTAKKQAEYVVIQTLKPALARHQEPRTRRRLSSTDNNNPGSLPPSSFLSDHERRAMVDWRKYQTLAALSACLQSVVEFHYTKATMRGVASLRRAWVILKKTGGDMTLIESWIYEIYETVSSTVRMMIRALGIHPREPEDDHTNMEQTELTLYRIILRLRRVFRLVDQEYRLDRTAHIKEAHQLVSDLVSKHPTNIPYRWLYSEVLRRLGKPQAALVEVQTLGSSIQNEIRRSSFTVLFETGKLLFIQRDWTACEETLGRLWHDQENVFHASLVQQYEAVVMVSACCAMRGKIPEAVSWLERAERFHGWSEFVHTRRSDVLAWKWKLHTLQYRPHKRVLAYEVMYFLGYLKWFDTDIACSLRVGGQTNTETWLYHTRRDLLEMHHEAKVSVTYCDPPHITEQSAAEELLVVSLMCGAVEAMYGNLDAATAYFKHVVDNVETVHAKEGTKSNPWHLPFALYELGSMELRRDAMLTAKTYFEKCLSVSGQSTFSFRSTLVSKCNIALGFIHNRTRASQNAPEDEQDDGRFMLSDELGKWFRPSSSSAQGEGEDGLDALSRMTSAVVPREEKFAIFRKMSPNDTACWIWMVETHNVNFKVTFTPQQPRRVTFLLPDDKEEAEGEEEEEDEEEELVEPVKVVETGEVVRGQFTTTTPGTLKLWWDNCASKYTDKRIRYYCYIII